jgi:ATPase
LNCYVPDESAISLKVISRMVEDGRISGRIVIHNSIIASIESKASNGNVSGVRGLKELREVCEKKGVTILYYGEPRSEDLNHSIRELASEQRGSIVTCNPVMASVSEALGLEVILEPPSKSIDIEGAFGDGVMSLHLKEGLPARVKRGQPGSWFFESISDGPISREELELIIADIMAKTYQRLGEDAFIEEDKPGATIIQLRDYRIVITRQPFSDGIEITVTRPVLKKRIEDYNLPDGVVRRLEDQAEGIIVAGPPGMGKSTFAQALAEHYNMLGKVVKTIESPRDLDVPAEVTQYSKKAAQKGELHDVLLLSRPDYTIFDEMRTDEDFRLFIDLRFAGVGMVGVMHGTSPIDAIRRVANKIDVGVLPSIVDTLIFMDNGKIAAIHTLEMEVKVPVGLRREDLARPVVLMKNLFTGKAEYELYVFGRNTFIVPVKGKQTDDEDRRKLFFNQILSRHLSDYDLEISGGIVHIKVPRQDYRTYTKKCQNRILKLARKSGLEVEAVPFEQ